MRALWGFIISLINIILYTPNIKNVSIFDYEAIVACWYKIGFSSLIRFFSKAHVRMENIQKVRDMSNLYVGLSNPIHPSSIITNKWDQIPNIL